MNDSQIEIPPTDPDQVTQKPAGSSWRSEIKSFLHTVIFLVIAIYVLRGSVVEAFKIPSESMVPTLRIGDHLLVEKVSYGLRLDGIKIGRFRFLGTPNALVTYSLPSRGDIVVFTRPDDPRSPEDDSEINIIKRVIGLPGDKVEVRGTKVLINDQPLDEPYARWLEGGMAGNFGPETVPPGRVFLMGDNRDHSKDSRFWSDPFLDVRLIVGRALFIYWSFNSMDRIGTILR